MWHVTFDDDCERWFWSLDADLRLSVLAGIQLLKERGPELPRPYSNTIQGSSVHNLKELRVKHRNHHWRILYVFDPIRQAILLVGGDKTGDKNWYRIHIPIAEARYQDHLKRLEKEHGKKFR